MHLYQVQKSNTMSSSFYYKATLFISLALLLTSCGAKKSTVSHTAKSEQHDVVEYSMNYLNKPYRYAGKGPHSFDCSGYTSFVFKKFGYNLNSSSAGQARQSKAINNKKELEIGDLVFFEGRRRNGRVGHVGIVSEIDKNGRFKFIHASTSNGVIITSSEEPYYRSRYLRGGRILNDIPNRQEQPKPHKEELATTQKNYIKTQEGVVFKETPDGFVLESNTTSKPLEGKLTVSTKQTPQTKPVKKEKEEEERKKQRNEIRQTAIQTTEESLVTPPNQSTHKVKPGETLYSIAKKLNCTVEELKEWNPEIINNSIQAGDSLVIYK